MKKSRLLLFILALTSITFTACEETLSDMNPKTFEGIYLGNISSDPGSSGNSSFDATAEITDIGNGQMEVHCYGGTFDTTFVLHHFQNHDSIMVCLDSIPFENMYGYMMGQCGYVGNDTTNTNGSGGTNWNGNGCGNSGMNGNGNWNGGMMGSGGTMGNSNSGMMGSGGTSSGTNGNSTSWSDHMMNDHQAGDQHYGGFDMTSETFEYLMIRPGSNYHFKGTKSPK